MFPSTLDRLEPAQYEAATHEGTALRILAGAGTGKTTTLTSRVAWLIDQGLSPERILLVTFTRRAAADMTARTRSVLAEMSGSPHGVAARTVTAGTFHSIAHRMLRRYAATIGLPEGFSVMDTSDAADLIDIIRNELGASGTDRKRFPKKATLLDIYSRSINTSQPVSHTIATIAPWCSDRAEVVAEICKTYVAEKRRLGLIDFDDLLLFWKAIGASEQLGAHMADGFDHVCVDEYQDVNTLQVDILKSFAERDVSLTVVGDDCQAIYGFRGSSPDHILKMEADFPNVSTVLLEQNHRSTQPILDVANAIADDAPRGFVGRLRSHSTAGEPPLLIGCRDDDDQSHSVCTQILELREQGIDLREQAVLVRASHHSAALELELSRRCIPYVKYGGLKYLEAAHVKDLLALFRIADNPRDELSWFRLLQLFDGVGPTRAKAAIVALGIDEDTTIAEVLLRWGFLEDALSRRCREETDALRGALAKATGETATSHATRLRDALSPLIERNYSNYEARIADLDTLVAAVGSSQTLSEVATDLTLDAPSSTGDLATTPSIDEDWMTISTVHSAKGLEWDAVHIIAAADGNFPADMALSTKEGLEEERRLFYVATTRARRHLNVYVPQRFHVVPNSHDNRHVFAQRSRFLSEEVVGQFAEVAPPAPTAIDRAQLDVAADVSLGLESLWA